MFNLVFDGICSGGAFGGRPANLAALLGLELGTTLQALTVRVLGGLVLGLHLALGLLQPRATRRRVGHLAWQLIPAGLPELLILGLIDRLRFG